MMSEHFFGFPSLETDLVKKYFPTPLNHGFFCERTEFSSAKSSSFSFAFRFGIQLHREMYAFVIARILLHYIGISEPVRVA